MSAAPGIHPYALAAVVLTREVEVCSSCGCMADDCDHTDDLAPVRLWRPAIALGELTQDGDASC